MKEHHAETAWAAGVVLFDGVCNLCNGAVRFIIDRDPAGRFRFASLQSLAAREVLGAATVEEPLPDSIVLVERDRVTTRSTAALQIARRLQFPWPLLYAFIVVPRRLRDAVYDVVARNRYRWFGRREVCMVPTPGMMVRFLGAEATEGTELTKSSHGGTE
jgi:predicted DCC family thiol-disulfide oxidoreductase YuxK